MVFRPDQDQPKFTLFPETKTTMVDRFLVVLQITLLALLVRLVMVMTGVMFFFIPVVDPIMADLARWITSLSR